MYFNNKTNTLTGTNIRDNSIMEWDAPEMGKQGILVKETITSVNKDTGEEQEDIKTHILPPIAGRYEKGDGVIYLIPMENGGYLHSTAEEVEKGTAWAKRGNRRERNAMKNQRLQDIWHEVAEKHAITPPSPRVFEGYPPTAPENLSPVSKDIEQAKTAWALLGQRIAPAGRWLIGLSLLSPWLRECGGTSSAVHLVGEGGAGKSLIGQAAAAIYGPPGPEDDALFGSFDSSGQGITSHAQSLSYYPVILDEVNSSTGEIDKQLTALLMGAKRKRAGRTGQAIKSKAKWGGVVITTGNAPLNLTHEMFDRRLINIQAGALWNRELIPADYAEAAAWWAENVKLMNEAAGWAWYDFTKVFTPGTQAAQNVVDVVAKITPPGPGNLGIIGKLGVAGTQWLSDWTDEPAWTAGVYEAIVGLNTLRQAEKKDVAKEAAEALIDDMNEYPQLWKPYDPEYMGNTHGYPAKGVSYECEVQHEDPCYWVDVIPSVFKRLIPVDPVRLSKDEKFKKAMYRPYDEMSRKVSVGRTRTRVNTVCRNGLELLSSPLDPMIEQVMNNNSTTPKTIWQTTAELDNGRKFIANESDDIRTVLDKALNEGYTDVVGLSNWYLPEVEGYTTKSKGNAPSCMMVRVDDNKKIRVWLTPDTKTKPAEWLNAVKTFVNIYPKYVAPSTLAMSLLLEPNRGEQPKWQLNDTLADLWKPETILHAVQWGKTKTERAELELTQYDRNKAHLSALTSANLAPLLKGEEWEHYESNAPVDRKWAGMYLMKVPEWNSVLPNPGGMAEAGSVLWTSAEIVRLYHERNVYPEIVEAWLAPVHKIAAVHNAAKQYREWLDEFEGTEALRIVKASYQQLAGIIDSEQYSRGKYNRIYRPDWAQAIRDNSWANVCRVAYKVYEADNNFVPVSMNVDAIYYPAHLGTPPEMVIGDKISNFKEVK